MTRLAAGLLVFLLPVLFAWRPGTTLAGRLLMEAGWSGAAAYLFTDPAGRGAALYAAGRWDEAAAAFGPATARAYDRGNALARAGRFVEAILAYDAAIIAQPDNADARFNRTLVTTLAFAAHESQAADATAGDRMHTPPQGGRAGTLVETRATGDGHGAAAGQGTAVAGSQGSGKVDRIDGSGDRSADAAPTRGFGSAGAGEGLGRSGDVMASVARQVAAREHRLPRMLETGSVQPSREWLDTLPDDPGQFLKLRLRAEQARRRALAGQMNQEPQ